MDFFFFCINKTTFAKADDAFVTCRDAMLCLLYFDKNISLYAYVWISFQHIQFHAFLRTVKIYNSLIIHNFHSKRYRNDIWIFLPLYADPHGIASSQNIKNLTFVLNFSVFTSHSVSP